MSKASDNVFPRFLISEGGSTATPAAGNVTVYAKADGLLYSKDDAGAETALGGGSGSSQVISFARAAKTSGNTSLTSATEASVDTGLDLTLAAATGDVAEVWINALVGNQNFLVNFDVCTLVSASPVNYFGVGLASTAQGLLGWSKQNSGTTYTNVSGSVHLVLVSGDISGGNVVLRLRYKATGTVTLFSSSDTAFLWGAKILRVG